MTEAQEDAQRRSPLSRVNGWIERTLESHTSANLLIIAVILVASLPILGIGYFSTRPIAPRFQLAEASPSPMQTSLASGVPADFACSAAKRISAIFAGNTVDLTLSDGRQLTLPLVRSGASARYANPDGSFIFLNDGRNAQITENGVISYAGCAEL